MPLPALTIFDLETTGLDPKRGHKIIEIAGVRIENGIITDKTFQTFVNPERDLPLEARNINHIHPDDVKDAPTIMNALPSFLEFSHGTVLFAHNAAFDRGFLEVEKELCWGYVDLPLVLCSLTLSRNLYPMAAYHNLDAICERFKLMRPRDRHRALPDVLVTAQALLKMIGYAKIQSLDELKMRSQQQSAAARKPALRAA